MGKQIEIFFTIDQDDDCMLWTRHDAVKPVIRKRSSSLSRDWLFLPALGEGLEKDFSLLPPPPPPLPPLFNSRQEALKTQVISLLSFFSISEIYMLVKKAGSVYIEFISEKKGHFSQVFIKVSVTLIKCKDLDF